MSEKSTAEKIAGTTVGVVGTGVIVCSAAVVELFASIVPGGGGNSTKGVIHHGMHQCMEKWWKFIKD